MVEPEKHRVVRRDPWDLPDTRRGGFHEPVGGERVRGVARGLFRPLRGPAKTAIRTTPAALGLGGPCASPSFLPRVSQPAQRERP